MFVWSVATFTIQRREIRTAGLPPEPLLKLFRTIGSVPYAVRVRRILSFRIEGGPLSRDEPIGTYPIGSFF
jgi:hypothetical protein